MVRFGPADRPLSMSHDWTAVLLDDEMPPLSKLLNRRSNDGSADLEALSKFSF